MVVLYIFIHFLIFKTNFLIGLGFVIIINITSVFVVTIIWLNKNYTNLTVNVQYSIFFLVMDTLEVKFLGSTINQKFTKKIP